MTTTTFDRPGRLTFPLRRARQATRTAVRTIRANWNAPIAIALVFGLGFVTNMLTTQHFEIAFADHHRPRWMAQRLEILQRQAVENAVARQVKEGRL